MAGPEVSFEVHREVDQVRLAVSGDLDLASAEQLANRALALIPDAPDRLVVDFSGVAFCDSAGIRALLTVRRAALEAGREMRLTGVRDRHVRWVLHVTALDTVIPVDEPFEPAEPGDS
jgi:anti-sigma B factor antagonist